MVGSVFTRPPTLARGRRGAGGSQRRYHRFTPSTDVIALNGSVFTGLTGGTLDPAAFALGKANAPFAQVIYNPGNGALFFDADGSGSGAAVQFATLHGHPALDHTAFTFV